MAAGKGIGRGELTNMRIVDVPSVVLHALGVKQPVSWTGHTIWHKEQKKRRST